MGMLIEKKTDNIWGLRVNSGEQAKLKEEQFIERLRENLKIVDATSGLQAGDNLAELRKLTGGKLLRNELETKYPLGKTLSVHLTAKAGLFGKKRQPIVLSGRVVIRLDRFVKKGNDEEPISLAEINSILAKESDLANRGRYESILGLYSPAGWAEDARAFIENEPPGSGWASNSVYPILIGPEITELVWDTKSDKLGKYTQCFCGLTLTERVEVCKKQINHQITVKEFANLKKIAQSNGFALDFVKKVAKEIASGSKDLVVAKVSGVGLVLKKKI